MTAKPRCIHATGPEPLCQECQRQYDDDPQAYLEFGDHPDGMARWAEEKRKMQEYRRFMVCHEPSADDLPF